MLTTVRYTRRSAPTRRSKVLDLRVLNPLDCCDIARPVETTGLLVVVDGRWSNCGTAGEVAAQMSERINPRVMRGAQQQVTLPTAPAPTRKPLEAAYFPTAEQVAGIATQFLELAGKVV
jgi:acetoin:2,6-dichlorophenolindophenol oxidoreductase subunit beta